MVNSDSENKRLLWLCRYLLDENPRYRQMPFPGSLQERRDLFRALMSVRSPMLGCFVPLQRWYPDALYAAGQWKSMSARTPTSWRMAASYQDVTLIRINKGHRDCQTPGIRHFIGLETL